MDLVALAGLAALLFVKEAGLPVPVPGDLLVVAAGVASAGTGAQALAALGAILLAGYAGGCLQFLFVRGALRRVVLRILAALGIDRERIDRLAGWLRRRGAPGVAVARVTPAVRVGAIAASGLAALPFPVFMVGLLVGNGIFVSAHFALGFVIGPPAQQLFAGLGTLAIALVLAAVLAALGAGAWRLRRRREGRFAGWAEGACPACVLLMATRPDLAED